MLRQKCSICGLAFAQISLHSCSLSPPSKARKIVIDNALLVSPDEKEAKPDRYEYVIGTSGIRRITMDCDKNAPVYNLHGQRLTALKKGINIVGGKKVLVK